VNKSTITFKDFFYEDMTSSDSVGGSVGGFSSNNITSSDFYAPGDSRVPTGNSVISRAGKVDTQNRKKRRKKRRNKIKK
jgi:hypothetical protein